MTMRHALPGVLAVFALGAAAWGAFAAAPQESPYAGLESREIKAMAPERKADLLAGRGAGYALAAELNGYPGPRHVLDLADGLQLSESQRRRTGELFAEMQARARPLGAELVHLESELETLFRSGEIDRARLGEMTAKIGSVEAALRATHLGYHLEMAALLTSHQRAVYDRLRGYATPSGQGGHSHGGHGGGAR